MKNKLFKILILPIIGISLFSCINTSSSSVSENSVTSFTNPINITFKNYDSSIIYSYQIEKGDTPSYSQATPTRASDENFSYTFAGWDKEFKAATKDISYTAVYNKTVINDTYYTEGVNYTLSDDGTYYIASSFNSYKSGVIRSMSEIVIAKTYLNKPVKEIGTSFFEAKEPFSLEIVYLPDSITTINSKAFAYLDDFKQIVLSENVTTIKANAFNNCPKLCIYSYAKEKPSTWEEGYADSKVKTYFASSWEMVNAAPKLK